MIDKQKEIIRTVKFVLFSASAGIIQIGSFALFKELFGFKDWVAYLVSLILSVVWNFTLNRKFTFHSANNIPVAMLKVALFYAVFTPLSTLAEAKLTEDLLWNGYIVTALMMLANFVTEYIYDRFIVFGKSIDTAVKEEKK
jgi:putative flippase GtrA